MTPRTRAEAILTAARVLWIVGIVLAIPGAVLIAAPLAMVIAANALHVAGTRVYNDATGKPNESHLDVAERMRG